MRTWLLLPGSIFILALCGCPPAEMRVIPDLPDPIVETKPRPQPQTLPSTDPQKVSRTSGYPPGWIPDRGISSRWKVVVIHHSATPTGDARHFDAAHRAKGWDELGYHFVIGNGTDTPDGHIEVGSRWISQKHGAHCKVPGNYYNEHGIGICLVGDFDQSSPSPRQIESLARLVAFLCKNCNIPTGNVTTHGGVTGLTACPGRHFSLAGLMQTIGQKGFASAE
jgi:hypothetical protein